MKKGDGKGVEKYRKITLMLVGYIIYAWILRKISKNEVEEEEVIPKYQMFNAVNRKV